MSILIKNSKRALALTAAVTIMGAFSGVANAQGNPFCGQNGVCEPVVTGGCEKTGTCDDDNGPDITINDEGDVVTSVSEAEAQAQAEAQARAAAQANNGPVTTTNTTTFNQRRQNYSAPGLTSSSNIDGYVTVKCDSVTASFFGIANGGISDCDTTMVSRLVLLDTANEMMRSGDTMEQVMGYRLYNELFDGFTNGIIDIQNVVKQNDLVKIKDMNGDTQLYRAQVCAEWERAQHPSGYKLVEVDAFELMTMVGDVDLDIDLRSVNVDANRKKDTAPKISDADVRNAVNGTRQSGQTYRP